MIFLINDLQTQYRNFIHHKTGLIIQPVFVQFPDESYFNFDFYLPVTQLQEQIMQTVFGQQFWQHAAFRHFLHDFIGYEDYLLKSESGYIMIIKEEFSYEY